MPLQWGAVVPCDQKMASTQNLHIMRLFNPVLNVLWDILYYLTEQWFFSFPVKLGGQENLDRRQVCANFLRITLLDVTPEFYEVTCQKKFKEQVSSYCTVVAFGCGLLFLFMTPTICRFIFPAKRPTKDISNLPPVQNIKNIYKADKVKRKASWVQTFKPKPSRPFLLPNIPAKTMIAMHNEMLEKQKDKSN